MSIARLPPPNGRVAAGAAPGAHPQVVEKVHCRSRAATADDWRLRVAAKPGTTAAHETPSVALASSPGRTTEFFAAA